jgi:acetolactate synthase-1/2/3 large subunit
VAADPADDRSTTAAQAIAAGIAAHGAGPVFGVLGEGSLAVVDALVQRHRRPYVAAAREDGAVLMADAFGRVSGGVGVAALTHGPALTNAVTALTEAARAGTPTVVLVGDTPVEDRRNPQDIDQAAVVAPTGAGIQLVRSARCAPEDVALAFRRAILERRPIVLNVPTPLLPQPAPEGVMPTGVLDLVPPGPPPPAVIGAAADLLASSARPLILAGRGAVVAEARDALLALAERTGALVGTSLLAKGLFAGDPYDVGVCGGYASAVGRDLIAKADCVVAAGASLNGFTTDGGALLGQAAAIQVDRDPAAFGRWASPPEVPVLGDVNATASALLDTLPSRPTRDTWRRPETAARLQAAGFADEFTPADGAAGIDLRSLVLLLDELVPPERTVVVDGGHAALSEPSRCMRVPDPQGFVFPLHFGSIGLALASAVGAGFARRDRPTLCFVGDGGLMMSLAELDTAVRHRLPLIVVVMNDAAYGWEYHQMRDLGMDPALSLIPRPDFAAVARGMGAEAVTATRLDDVAARPELLVGRDRPLLIDARLDRDVRTGWYATHASPGPG